jgi:hypothetical protein
LDVGTFFDLGGRMARLRKPHRMHFRDESARSASRPWSNMRGALVPARRPSPFRAGARSTRAAGGNQTDRKPRNAIRQGDLRMKQDITSTGGRVAHSSGVFFWARTLIALGVTALLSVVLSARGLWRLRSGPR